MTVVSRRTLAKGSAWAAPVILASSAAPAVAASTCPTSICLQGVVGAAPAAAAVITRNRGTLLVGPPAFTLIMTCSGIISVGILTVNHAVLTMSDGSEYSATSLAAGVAGGALGATVAGFTGLFAFPNVHFNNGIYAGALGLETSPVKPTKLCVNVTIPFNILIGGTNEVNCEQTATVCFRPTFVNATVGTVFLGAGTVTYATTWVPDSVH